MILLFFLPFIPVAFYMIVNAGAAAVWQALKAAQDEL